MIATERRGTRVELPGGLWLDGDLVADAELHPLTGRDEEWLATCPAELCTAGVVSELLSRCTRRVGDGRLRAGDAVRELLVADRDYLLLWLRRLTFGPRFDIVVTCPACRSKMDVTFEAGQVPVERRPQERRLYQVEVGSAAGTPLSVGFHLPTGRDQEAAARAEDPARDLLGRCVETVGGSPPAVHPADLLDEPALDELDAWMERLAPSVELEMELVCPECDHAFGTDYQLAPFMLEEMRVGSGSVLREVHGLAFHYHWSEREILDLPRSRRRAYLQLIGEQLRVQEG